MFKNLAQAGKTVLIVTHNPEVTEYADVIIKMKDGEVVEEVKKYFGDTVYQTIIPRNVRLSEAPSYGLPIVDYDEKSKGAIEYQALAKEVLAAHASKEK